MFKDQRGLDFVRSAIAKAVVDGEPGDAAARYAGARWGGESKPAWHLRGAIAAATTSDPSNAAPLADFARAGAEFFELVREKSLLGRMREVRSVPLETWLNSQTAGTTAGWVGQGQVIPISNGTFSGLKLSPLQVFAQVVATIELLRLSDPDAELILRDDLVAALSEAIDQTFTDPNNAGGAGIMPASVTYGAPSVASTGLTPDALTADLSSLVGNFEGDLSRAYFLGNPATLMLLFGKDRPNVGARGGDIAGIPALASRKVSQDILALVDAGGVGFANGGPQVDVSRQGTVQMNSAPNSPPTANTALVSLWQNNLEAIRVSQVANWSARAGSVAVLNGLSASS